MKKLLLFLFLLIGTYCLQAQELEIVKDIIIRTKDLSERVFEGDTSSFSIFHDHDKLDWGKFSKTSKTDSLYLAKCEEWFIKHFSKIIHEDKELQTFLKYYISNVKCSFTFVLIFERTTGKVAGISFAFYQGVINDTVFDNACVLYEGIKKEKADFFQYFKSSVPEARHIAIFFDLKQVILEGKIKIE
ncbi:hypothetical protein AAAX96_19140 [Butyricimonas faecihominis]|uniref:hypothetical protein n=1 Tax=Butyricimonas faecihominis TaxID=1472416 RepID=UPI000962B0A8|nr:MAG: hypothetical protein BHV81_07535 [Butyricimonas synergistica]